MKIYFFDTETTGNMPGDRLCQLAIKEEGVAIPLLNEYYKPPKPIPFEASAVHHISNKMVADKPAFLESPRYAEIKELFESPDSWVVAHNSAFDVGMLESEDIHPTNVICTYKVIKHLDGKKEFTSHKLQHLRYALDMELDVPAHDAFADVCVLEQLFAYLLDRVMQEHGVDKLAALAIMKEMTETPVLITEFAFGKYKGKTVEEVAATAPDYLQWLLTEKEKNPSGEDDWIYTLKHFLKRN
jgi:DNA polymerase III epsilon subunit-like protein